MADRHCTYRPYLHAGRVWLVKQRPSSRTGVVAMWVTQLIDGKPVNYAAIRERDGESFEVIAEDPVDRDTWINVNSVALRHHQSVPRLIAGSVVSEPYRRPERVPGARQADHAHIDLGSLDDTASTSPGGVPAGSRKRPGRAAALSA